MFSLFEPTDNLPILLFDLQWNLFSHYQLIKDSISFNYLKSDMLSINVFKFISVFVKCYFG